MRKHSILLIFSLTICIAKLDSAMATNSSQYFLNQKGKKEFIEFKTEGNTLFSKNCLNSNSCEAKKAYAKYLTSQKNSFTQKSTSAESEICQLMNGQIKILEDNQLQQRNFCFFSDQTALSLKELF